MALITCPDCSNQVSNQAKSCPNCGCPIAVTSKNADQGRNMTNETNQLASRWKRLGGALLDGLIVTAIYFPVMMAAGVFEQITQGEQITIGQRVFFFFFGLGGFLLINGYLLTKHGQTVGKKLVGTRIVSHADEGLLSLGHVFGLRYVLISVITQIPILGNVFALVDCLFIFRKDKRCVHDMIAGTKVVNV